MSYCLMRERMMSAPSKIMLPTGHGQAPGIKARSQGFTRRVFVEASDGRPHIARQPGAFEQALGFKETASFRHAFQRWSGVAPGRFRQLAGLPQGGGTAVIIRPAHVESRAALFEAHGKLYQAGWEG